MTPSQTIKQARKSLGVGQKRFGAWIGGYRHDTVRRWEHGKTPVPKIVLMFLAAYFNDEWPAAPEPSKGAQTWQQKTGL